MPASVGTSTVSSQEEMETAPAAESATTTTPTKTITLHLVGARIPNQASLWDFYDPEPTRISRPTKATTTVTTTTTEGDDDQEQQQEEEDDEWTEFCNQVDMLLAPVNQSRRLVLCLTTFAVIVALLLVVGIFTFAKSLWSDNTLLLALYVIVGFSILPILVLISIKCQYPSCIQIMKGEMARLCQSEQHLRGGQGCTIQFVNRDSEKGYLIEITVPDIQSV